jgi:hypothetical protein
MMRIIAEKDFIKVIEYELDFLHTEMKMGRAALVAALKRADAAELKYQQLVKTLGAGFMAEEWRNKYFP